MKCPRCGEAGYEERRHIGDRTYIYIVHERWSGGKRFRRRCYLGPVGEYEYVSRLHGDIGLTLRGLTDKDRILKYLYALTSKLIELELKPDECRKIAKHLEEIARNLRIKAVEKEYEKI